MTALELEVTIRLTVDRKWFEDMTDAEICRRVETEQGNITTVPWNAVSVRVAQPEPQVREDG